MITEMLLFYLAHYLPWNKNSWERDLCVILDLLSCSFLRVYTWVSATERRNLTKRDLSINKARSGL